MFNSVVAFCISLVTKRIMIKFGCEFIKEIINFYIPYFVFVLEQ